MKKIFCIAMAAMLLLGFAACKAAPGKGKGDTLTGTPEEVLIQVRESSHAILATSAGNEITGGSAMRVLGLTEEQFGELAESAYAEMPVIGTVAQRIAIVKCVDIAAAEQVKKLIAEGFDADQWAPGPGQCVVVESGSYVLLAVGTADATDALVRAFGILCEDNAGTPEVFFAE